MSKPQKIRSKDVGLEIGLIIEKHLFNSEHLHYGYWTENLPVTLGNLPQAQQQYCDFLIYHIPPGVKSILDVGCGAGKFTWQLKNAGFRVDAVSPSIVFSEIVQTRLGPESEVFPCKFEEMNTNKKYDLILFSESFQYVNMEKGFKQCQKLLHKPGFILICDFFKIGAPGECIMGGGHKWEVFHKIVKEQTYHNLKDIDITAHTAPTLDMVDHVLKNVGKPVWELVIRYLESKHRIVAKFLKWKFKKKIARINNKYFSGGLNAKNFSFFKSYRLLLYKLA